jgi:hypothetical protein
VHDKTKESCDSETKLRVWPTCEVNISEEWSTQVDIIPLNKSMRHMVDSDSMDSMMWQLDAGAIHNVLCRDWKSNQSVEKTL